MLPHSQILKYKKTQYRMIYYHPTTTEQPTNKTNISISPTMTQS